ncbi:hypothetical protein [Amycolatopsis sp. NPDC059021]|uniref:hypothetical protein n=1 Tax=Amycolatopsis sp. NPDC059021 TaxID=3346704 RepID=UPI00366B9B68
MGGFTYPFGVGGAPEIDAQALSARHPREYAALAYLLETAGHPVTGTYPTRFGDQEAAILEAGNAWLAGTDARR